MRRSLAWVLFLALLLSGWGIAHADGSRPPQPYHYLHPPPAQLSTNSPPQTGRLLVEVSGGKNISGYAFTDDGQAGVTVGDNVFKVPPGAGSLELHIQPVETPPNLPSNLKADGNAYGVTAVAQPGNHPAPLTGTIDITLRWPHIPIGMEGYTSGRWRPICTASTAIFTPATVTCTTSFIGTFLAVARATGASATKKSSSISPVAIISASAAVLIVAGIVALFVLRMRRRSPSPNPDS